LDSKSKEEIILAIYEYNCNKCNDNFIKQRSISEEDPGYQCEVCNSDLKRVYSIPGAIFTGTGFYSVDNRKK
jgi:hypothetical protein